MVPVKSIIQIDRDSQQAVFLQIANALIREIKRGRIRPGTRLPGTRNLADSLEIHRNTAVSAYDELAAQGWTETRASKGTFVKTCLPDLSPHPLKTDQMDKPEMVPESGYEISELPFEPRSSPDIPAGFLALNDGSPDVRLTPVSALAKAYRRVMHRGLKLSYGDEAGDIHTRKVFADYLNETRGLQAKPENLLITRGSQMALYLAIMAVVDAGEHVVMAEQSYHSVEHVFNWAGAVIHRVPIDDKGIDVNALEKLCQRTQIKAIYVVPHHQYPTTVSLVPQRRMKLLDMAKKYGFAIIEDDHDFDFHYKSSPILPLASSDYRGQVIYTGSFSKTIAPSFRIGFMTAPNNIIQKARKIRRIVDRQGDQILEKALAELIQEGEVRRHLRKTLNIYNKRRNIFCRLLREKLSDYLHFNIPDGGMALWLQFDTPLNPDRFCGELEDEGIFLSPDNLYEMTNGKYAVRIGFASLNEEEIEQTVEAFAEVLKTM
ncbi:PLP-dependent aminotransferase family protein [Fodinibius salsisoli]|uniref:PLP-dependent aminotransferase family protein n=1 Tax=Fodinibius salsisoli TaxID=2820877 RepID=A0ABT3PMB0_9BACT|nr:PLP-dependent aminotransferase family protein [Fodinibius salsisoli]MCW9707086.1 PLP-dependent aminotransferase family protein [Fodinibius salsisoli]